MRFFYLLLVVAVIGAAIGVGLTLTRVEPAHVVHPASAAAAAVEPAADPRYPPLPPPDGPQPALVVDGPTVYDFGEMEWGTSGSHSWLFRNVGDYPLELRQGESTCKCTIAGVDSNKIPPGESAQVTLKWTVKGRQPLFRQSAAILTNDPNLRHVELVAKGTVTDTLRIVPNYFSARKPRKQPKTFQAKIFCLRTDDFQITGHRFSDESLAPFFDVQIEPLGEENVLRAWGAKGAKIVSITVSPGLPDGAIDQRLILSTNIPQRPEVMVSLALSDVDAVSLVSKGWNARQQTLDLGDISQSTGLRRKARLMIHGQAASEPVDLKVVDVVPDFVKITSGRSERKGNSLSIPLEIKVPAGAPLSNYMGGKLGRTGHVKVETTHPHAPSWSFQLRFTVVP